MRATFKPAPGEADHLLRQERADCVEGSQKAIIFKDS